MTKQRNLLSRSVYRKTRCSDRMYFTVVDGVHVAAWYDPDMDGMEVELDGNFDLEAREGNCNGRLD